MTSTEQVERVARAVETWFANHTGFYTKDEEHVVSACYGGHWIQIDCEEIARAAIAAVGDEWRTEPTEAMWNGLARDIMMWLDMHPKTPRALFAHLKATGREIPQWLRDDPEMQNLDHLPSKGTRCVLIYRAMVEARTLPKAPDVTEKEKG